MKNPTTVAPGTSQSRDDARRWLKLAERNLSLRDLSGSKHLAARARNADPELYAAEEILAVINTLIAGDRRIQNNQPDWYGVLGLEKRSDSDLEIMASKYRTLMLTLNPNRNKFPFAEEASRLVTKAWDILSDPARRSSYHTQLSPRNHQSDDGVQRRQRSSTSSGGSSFWTVCPYCYYMYEYPSIYVDCALQCHNCHNASQAVPIPSPPVGESGFYRCWGILPFGCSSVEAALRDRTDHNVNSAWTPFLPMGKNNQLLVNENGRGGESFSCPSLANNNKAAIANVASSQVDKTSVDKGKNVIINNGRDVVVHDPHVMEESPNIATGGSLVINTMQQPADSSRIMTFEVPDSTTNIAINQACTVGMSIGNLDKNGAGQTISNEAQLPNSGTGNADGPAKVHYFDENDDFFKGVGEYIRSLSNPNWEDDKAETT